MIERIGEANWELLLPRVLHFLATALLHLKEQGHAPQLDYAPISIEVVKGLEVELSEVLRGFRDSVSDAPMSFSEDDQADRSLASFLKGKKPPTLGTISYLLRSPSEDSSELRVALHRYLIGLPNGDFLTGNKFVKRDLQRIINKYRNGGVHDSPIPEEVCRDCVSVVIGTPERLGCIPQVVQWKTGGSG